MATLLAPSFRTLVYPKRDHSTKLQKQTSFNFKTPKFPKGKRSVQRIFGLPIALLVMAIVAAIYFTRPPAFHQPKTFQELLSLTPAQINQCDVGLISLLCAEGLVGSENLNVETALKYLDKANTLKNTVNAPIGEQNVLGMTNPFGSGAAHIITWGGMKSFHPQ